LSMRYYCNECKKTIPEAEYNYSTQHFNRPLCRACQKNNSSLRTKTNQAYSKTNEDAEEIDLSGVVDVSKKVWKGVKEVSKAVKESSVIRERDFNKWIDDWRKAKKIDFKIDQKHFFLSGNDLEEFINSIIHNAEKTILLTNPYVENCALIDNLIKARQENNTEVKIVLRPEPWNPKRVECQDRLSQAGIQVKKESRIHSKIIVADDKVAVVSSMNFYPGSLAGQSLEAGIVSFYDGVVNATADYVNKFFV